MARQVSASDVRDTLAVQDRLSTLDVPARVVWGVTNQFQKIAYGERFARDLRTAVRRIEGGKHGRESAVPRHARPSRGRSGGREHPAVDVDGRRGGEARPAVDEVDALRGEPGPPTPDHRRDAGAGGPGTVDVREDRADRCLVLYSTEITPDTLADLMGPAVEAGVRGLKGRLER